MIKTCLKCDLPMVTSQHVNAMGYKSWSVAECTNKADIILSRVNPLTSYNMHMTYNTC